MSTNVVVQMVDSSLLLEMALEWHGEMLPVLIMSLMDHYLEKSHAWHAGNHSRMSQEGSEASHPGTLCTIKLTHDG